MSGKRTASASGSGDSGGGASQSPAKRARSASLLESSRKTRPDGPFDGTSAPPLGGMVIVLSMNISPVKRKIFRTKATERGAKVKQGVEHLTATLVASADSVAFVVVEAHRKAPAVTDVVGSALGAGGIRAEDLTATQLDKLEGALPTFVTEDWLTEVLKRTAGWLPFRDDFELKRHVLPFRVVSQQLPAAVAGPPATGGGATSERAASSTPGDGGFSAEERAVIADFNSKTYSCQRRTNPRENVNKELCELLGTLIKVRELEKGDRFMNALAYMRARSVLRACPLTVRSTAFAKELPHLGGPKVISVIDQYLRTGTLAEVEAKQRDQRFQSVLAMTKVFGLGRSTAQNLYDRGFPSLDDIVRAAAASDPVVLQILGSRDTLLRCLPHHRDLAAPLYRDEAEMFVELLSDAFRAVEPRMCVGLAGGFRRGQECGHDLDVLCVHPDGKQQSPQVMERVLAQLRRSELLKLELTEHSAGLHALDCDVHYRDSDDVHPKLLCLMQLPPAHHSTLLRNRRAWQAAGFEASAAAPGGPADEPRRLRRVDVIVIPHHQRGFGLLGWTGTSLYERDLRRWAKEVRGVHLSNYWMYSMDTKQPVPFDSDAPGEDEILAKLGLPFLFPWERCA